MYPLLIAAAAAWGAATGVLLPRAAYRLAVEPEEPWRGDCPAGHPLTGPFGGWVGRARCADGTAYGPRTAVVAAVTALACALLAAATGPRPELAVWLLTAPVAVLLALTDYAVHRLPDVLTLPLAAAAALLLGLAALLPGSAGSWPTALLGAVVLGGAYFVLFLINPGGMGFGDVKLAVGLGAALGWYGWRILLTGAFAGLLFGAVYGLSLMALRRAGRKSAIPLGPFMIGGAFVGLVLGGLAAG
ncbi:prepilin peptidase [Streptomyces himalayensis]|uniref:Prepilin peptidase n=1 Tax=Streptomyces himalayensis subsp. himalayensis TaxID=2756131 RepID=A0A7W0I6T2_9ACTN|nr:A24 family peptidase [Streptomyces himalayensis]MBA2944254.1 prepilin peptidase [Streptomyces himalayensis subsp. himalayensis]